MYLASTLRRHCTVRLWSGVRGGDYSDATRTVCLMALQQQSQTPAVVARLITLTYDGVLRVHAISRAPDTNEDDNTNNNNNNNNNNETEAASGASLEFAAVAPATPCTQCDVGSSLVSIGCATLCPVSGLLIVGGKRAAQDNTLPFAVWRIADNAAHMSDDNNDSSCAVRVELQDSQSDAARLPDAIVVSVAVSPDDNL